MFRGLRQEKTINPTASMVLCLRKDNCGEIRFIKITKKVESISAAPPTRIMLVFIFSFFLSEFARNLTMVLSNPSKLKVEIILITEIRAVAIPILSVETSRALITQKIKPKPAITAVESMR